MFAYGSHRFFACLNYPTFCICNQPCIAFIYLLFIFSFAVDGKRAPTVVSRGSSPRSRTGCDIFNCIAALPASHIPQHFTAGFQSYAATRTASTQRCSPYHRRLVCFNLTQSRGLCYAGQIVGVDVFSILCSQHGLLLTMTLIVFCFSNFQSYAAY